MEENKIAETVDETTEIETPSVETNIEVAAVPDAEPEDVDADDKIDYKAELQLAQSKLKKAEFALYKKNKAEKEPEEEVEAATDLEQIIDRKVEERLSGVTSGILNDFIDDKIAELSSNPDEQALIRYNFENTIRRSGVSKKNISDDLEKAYLLANASKLKKRVTEMAVTAKSKKTSLNTSLGGNQQRVEAKEDVMRHFTPTEQKFMKDRGWTDAMIAKAAREKLAQP